MKMMIKVHNNESRQKQAHLLYGARIMAIARAALASTQILLFFGALFDIVHSKPRTGAEHLPTSTRHKLNARAGGL